MSRRERRKGKIKKEGGGGGIKSNMFSVRFSVSFLLGNYSRISFNGPGFGGRSMGGNGGVNGLTRCIM